MLHILSSELITLRRRRMIYKKYVKRILDIAVAIILSPILLLFIVIVGLIIYLEDNGPIFYCGKRLGYDGEIYKMYKFRSMKVDAPDIRNTDGSTFNSNEDLRLTRIGRILRLTSIDEIPQILNVLKGDMSFVGPRPDLPEHIYVYDKTELLKLSVLPGITGYNQAYFRNSIDWKKRLCNDVYYAKKVSFLLDLKIIGQTIRTIISKKGIFIEGN